MLVSGAVTIAAEVVEVSDVLDVSMFAQGAKSARAPPTAVAKILLATGFPALPLPAPSLPVNHDEAVGSRQTGVPGMVLVCCEVRTVIPVDRGAQEPSNWTCAM